MELGEQIIAKIEGVAGTVNDYDQRSALGMARSWVEHGRLDTWNAERHGVEYKNRDNLAVDIVALLAGADVKEQIKALGEARGVVNEPFWDERSNGAQTGKALLKPRDKKKRDANE